MDTSLIYKAVEKYKAQVEMYQARISAQQADIVKDQTWIHKLEAEIQEYKEAMTEKVDIIKDYQSKIFGAQEAIVALNEITE